MKIKIGYGNYWDPKGFQIVQLFKTMGEQFKYFSLKNPY